MPRIHFAILAHANEPCVADLVRSLWDLHPGCQVSIYNGGKNKAFFAGQGVPICPYSSPLRYGNLTPFHYGVMRWLTECRIEFDFLITLDHDVLPLRSGLSDYLAERLPEIGYLGARFREAGDPSTWAVDTPTVREIQLAWRRHWRRLLGTDVPYWAFNPGQVFTHGLVERIVRDPSTAAVMRLAARSRVWAVEELVYPTLAVGLGATASDWPGEQGLQFAHHTPAEIEALKGHPDVFLLHRAGMSLASPDRLAAHGLAPYPWAEEHNSPATTTDRKRGSAASTAFLAREKFRRVQIRLRG